MKNRLLHKFIKIKFFYQMLQTIQKIASINKKPINRAPRLAAFLESLYWIFEKSSALTLFVLGIILVVYSFQILNPGQTFNNNIWSAVDRSVQKSFIIDYTIVSELKFWQLQPTIVSFIFTFISFIIIRIFFKKMIGFLRQNEVVNNPKKNNWLFDNKVSVGLRKYIFTYFPPSYFLFSIILTFALLTAPTLHADNYNNFQSNLYFLYDIDSKKIYYGIIFYFAIVFLSFNYFLILILFFVSKSQSKNSWKKIVSIKINKNKIQDDDYDNKMTSDYDDENYVVVEEIKN